MGFVPEFFVLLGICIFLAASLLSALLIDNLPSFLQYIFQLPALLGLVEILMGQGLANSTRFWVSLAYLAFALSSLVGLDVYLGLVRRRIALSSAFSGAVIVPILMVSVVFVSSFLGNGGAVNISPVAIVTLAVLASVASLSIFGFLRELSRHVAASNGQLSSPPLVESSPPNVLGMDLALNLSPTHGEGWEEYGRREDGN
ncbi:MAG TPA: hypothetical protein VE955_11595 [Candidatus Dormibacteraeota bacterium]|nr:hypothetical protein [Candidatus Dormibacteraeota bacterium]